MSSATGVGLSVDAPSGSLGRVALTGLHTVDDLLVGRLPVTSWIDIGSHFVTSGGEGQRGTVGLAEGLLGSAKRSVVEEVRLMNEFVPCHGVHALSWDFVVSWLNICVGVLVID